MSRTGLRAKKASCKFKLLVKNAAAIFDNAPARIPPDNVQCQSKTRDHFGTVGAPYQVHWVVTIVNTINDVTAQG